MTTTIVATSKYSNDHHFKNAIPSHSSYQSTSHVTHQRHSTSNTFSVVPTYTPTPHATNPYQQKATKCVRTNRQHGCAMARSALQKPHAITAGDALLQGALDANEHGLAIEDYLQATEQGITHQELMEFTDLNSQPSDHSSTGEHLKLKDYIDARNAGLPHSEIARRIAGKSLTHYQSRLYLEARATGATHRQTKRATKLLVLLDTYTRFRRRGLSHHIILKICKRGGSPATYKMHIDAGNPRRHAMKSAIRNKGDLAYNPKRGRHQGPTATTYQTGQN
jgi:hypothetical protein